MARDSLLTPNENTVHSCSFLPILVHEVLPERSKLTEDEIIKVESLILQLVQNKDDEVDHLVAVWWSLRRRGVSHFGHATHGFIKYISYSSAKICNHGLADSDFEPLKQKAGSYTLRATLYALHILLIYGAELKYILEPALSTGPLSPTMAGSNSRIVCSVKFSSRASGSEAVGGLTNDAGQAISLVHCLPNTS
ncbi:uncharacterized protein Pyn_09186 [Prunus yedoensis var. nudiflora]|uniref:Uncharacterized protein n=1 Tax=Prunus yedoensis var. nudiflora TaxID=2094558 RepID=A0A314Z8G0_PRUYE|nr:uncharacterized protein Pyn_09186 [Prunus yedoensis var. nudiflora]